MGSGSCGKASARIVAPTGSGQVGRLGSSGHSTLLVGSTGKSVSAGPRVDDGLGEEKEEENQEEVLLECLERNKADWLVVGGRAHFHLGVSEKHCG